MSETKLREKLAEIDLLREKADDFDALRKRWGYYDEEMVEVVTVRRRLLRNKKTEAETVMSPEESQMLCDWLMLRAGQLRLKANELSEELEGAVK